MVIDSSLMVNIKGLSFTYKKDSPLFLNFNWQIVRGERWSIIGPSGCGKTTLLYLLAGLRAPESGVIEINHDHSHGSKPYPGLILQDFGLLPWYTAMENVLLGLKIHKADKQASLQVARKWLKDLGLETVAGHFPGELSGGQRQRVAIARTLALEPDLLLMDEPFASLDTLTREDLLELTLEIWGSHPTTMVLVTHNIEEAVFWGQKILVLGPAPNASPRVLDNADSGSAGYRSSPGFLALSRQLRELQELTMRPVSPGGQL
jgi:ABC-type nitrate/sulfonate/bicarbonate transport system ATPase subunit